MNHVFIIAEAGVNHNGSLEKAIEMVDAAADAGADAVKFQTFKAEKLITASAPKAQYQKEATGVEESQLEMVKNLELDEAAHRKLLEHCRSRKIVFLSTPFDMDSIDLLKRMDLEIFKIPSGEITNMPYLRKIGALNKQIILSTGMADLGEIEDALDIFLSSGTGLEKITVLHCNTEYPTAFEEVNLKAMQTIGKAFGVATGYSDHTPGIEVAIAAAALGAKVIEKHFTLDRNLPGPDHKASLEPKELKAMVQAIRNIEKALGDGIKKPSPSEIKNRDIARKSIVANTPIKAGEPFTTENITVKRPGTGISSMRWDEIIGKISQKNYNLDELI